MTSKIQNLIDSETAETIRTWTLGASIGGCLIGTIIGNEVAQWTGLTLAVIWIAWTMTRRAILSDRASD